MATSAYPTPPSSPGGGKTHAPQPPWGGGKRIYLYEKPLLKRVVL